MEAASNGSTTMTGGGGVEWRGEGVLERTIEEGALPLS